VADEVSGWPVRGSSGSEATFQTLTVSLTGGECDAPCGVTLTVSPDGSGVLDARAPTLQVVFRPSDLEPLVSAFNASYERISGLPSVDCPPQYDGHQLAVRVVGVDGADRELAECLHGLIPSDDVYRHAESLLDRGIEQADE